MPRKGQIKSRCQDCGVVWWDSERHEVCVGCAFEREARAAAQREHERIWGSLPTFDEMRAQRRAVKPYGTVRVSW